MRVRFRIAFELCKQKEFSDQLLINKLSLKERLFSLTLFSHALDGTQKKFCVAVQALIFERLEF